MINTVKSRDEFFIFTECHDQFASDKKSWTDNLLSNYFIYNDLVSLNNTKKLQPVGLWDISVISEDKSLMGVNSFNRWKLGLMDYVELSKPGIYEIDDLNGDGANKGYKIKIPGSNDEWLLMENRQKTGLDSLLDGIQSTGIVMYHYDNECIYNYDFNRQSIMDNSKLNFGLKIFDNSNDLMHEKASWSQDTGKNEMNYRNSPDDYPLFFKGYKGLHIVIKNISKSGPKMTFELDYENSSPNFVTKVETLDFGNVRKGSKKSLPCEFFYNHDGEIELRFSSLDAWVTTSEKSIIVGKEVIDVTVDTTPLKNGTNTGKLKYASDSFINFITLTVNAIDIVGDVNGDGKVAREDFEAFKTVYGLKKDEPGFIEMADFDQNGAIDVNDFFLFSKYWSN